MTYLCIKPRCSSRCSMCNEAVLVPDPMEVGLSDLQLDESALTKAYAEGRKDEREAIGAVLKSHGIELRDDINGDVRAVKSET